MKDENTLIKAPADTELMLKINRALTLKAWRILEKAVQETLISFFTMLRKCIKQWLILNVEISS